MREKKPNNEKEKKEFITSSGIPVKRIYTPEDTAGLDYSKELGYPAEEPYTRGIYSTMYRGRPWTIRQFSGLDSAEATNKRYKMLYEMGTTGFAIAMDEASLEGFDPDCQRRSLKWELAVSMSFQ